MFRYILRPQTELFSSKDIYNIHIIFILIFACFPVIQKQISKPGKLSASAVTLKIVLLHHHFVHIFLQN